MDPASSTQIVGGRLKSLRRDHLDPEALAFEVDILTRHLDSCLHILGYTDNILACFRDLGPERRLGLFPEQQDVQNSSPGPTLELSESAFDAICEQHQNELLAYCYNWCLVKGPSGEHNRLARSESGARVVCKNCWDALTRKLRTAVARERQDTPAAYAVVPPVVGGYSDQHFRFEPHLHGCLLEFFACMHACVRWRRSCGSDWGYSTWLLLQLPTLILPLFCGLLSQSSCFCRLCVTLLPGMFFLVAASTGLCVPPDSRHVCLKGKANFLQSYVCLP